MSTSLAKARLGSMRKLPPPESKDHRAGRWADAAEGENAHGSVTSLPWARLINKRAAPTGAVGGFQNENHDRANARAI